MLIMLSSSCSLRSLSPPNIDAIKLLKSDCNRFPLSSTFTATWSTREDVFTVMTINDKYQ
jgi:hypothetical protein